MTRDEGKKRMTRAIIGGMGVAFLLLLVMLLPPPVRAKVFDPETFTLDNGMQVVVVTNRTAPVVSHMVWYKVGAADEPWGRSGIAHFVEHLMFRGTETVPDGEFSQRISREGGQDNAFTSWDFTAYYQNVASDRLRMVMELEADRMVNLALSDAVVLPERDVILEERAQRVDNVPGSRLSEQMYAALFQNHPYGIPIIGWSHEIAELTLEDVESFYETWYAPNNAILVVSGDIDAETLRPLAEATYGQISSRPVPERVRPMEPGAEGERRVVVTDPTVQQPLWRRFYLAPSYAHDPDGHAYALQVLSEVLGGGPTSRLYRSLVIDQGLAVSAGTGYSPNDLDYSVFVAVLAPTPGTDLEDAEAAFEEEVARIVREGVPEAEVEAAKARLAIAADYARDSLFGPARTLGAALATGQTIEDVESWPDRIRAVTAEEVRAAAEAVLTAERAVTGLLLPEAPPSPVAAAPPPGAPAEEAPDAEEALNDDK